MKIAIIGSGSWGTALSLVCARALHDVLIYSRRNDICNEINNKHTNFSRLKSIQLLDNIRASSNFDDVLSSDVILLVIPAQNVRDICIQLSKHKLAENTAIIICSKGIEQNTLKLMNEVVQEILPHNPLAILSGPNFAYEVARDLPAITSIAANDINFAETLAGYFSSNHFRIYPNNDIIGTQVLAAAKNVLAIATGIVIGKDLGENAKAAVISRGINEITNLLIAKGGKLETLISPAGFGDLYLTCSSATSRNTAYGISLGKNEPKTNETLVEGFFSAESIIMLANYLNVKMPICEAVYKIIHKNISIDRIIFELLEKPKAYNLIK